MAQGPQIGRYPQLFVSARSRSVLLKSNLFALMMFWGLLTIFCALFVCEVLELLGRVKSYLLGGVKIFHG